MHLLNLHTLHIQEFTDFQRPPYTILSHTWTDSEVSLQALQLRSPDIETTSGYLKILNFSRLSAANGFEWGWVDTCCIDKTSSAELSESINSMYRCESQQRTDKEFAKSRWFTRGWTLQELLAPEAVVFYLADWSVYGTKTTLREAISKVTTIPQLALRDGIQDFCIAQKMSWAAIRETTSVEDMSYCLLGIFGVNMPLIYGEGAKAFVRLQEEIMKIEVDLSIFAWPSVDSQSPYFSNTVPLLAPRPSVFASCGDIRNGSWGAHGQYSLKYRGTYSLTNKGVRIENLLVVKAPSVKDLLEKPGFQCRTAHDWKTLVFALLYCHRENPFDILSPVPRKVLGIVLYNGSHGTYYRHARSESLFEIDIAQATPEILNTCIIDTQFDPYVPDVERRQLWVIRAFPNTLGGFSISEIYANKTTEHNGSPAFHLGEQGFDLHQLGGGLRPLSPCGIWFSKNDIKEAFAIIVGGRSGDEWIDIVTSWEPGDLRRLVAEYHDAEQHHSFTRSPREYDARDRMSKSLHGGKIVNASIVRGLDKGERVFFLDISIYNAGMHLVVASGRVIAGAS